MSLEVGSVVASGEEDAIQKHRNAGIVLRLMLKQETAIQQGAKICLSQFWTPAFTPQN